MLTGKQNIELERGNHRIEVANTFPLLISFNDVPVRALQPGQHKFVLKTGSGVINIDPTEPKLPYGFEVHSRRSTLGEEVDDLPPPAPPSPDNYLQMIAMQVRQSMGVIRENFEERPSLYETDNAMFEEEEAAAIKEFNKKKKAEEAKKAKEAENSAVQRQNEEGGGGTPKKVETPPDEPQSGSQQPSNQKPNQS